MSNIKIIDVYDPYDNYNAHDTYDITPYTIYDTNNFAEFKSQHTPITKKERKKLQKILKWKSCIGSKCDKHGTKFFTYLLNGKYYDEATILLISPDAFDVYTIDTYDVQKMLLSKNEDLVINYIKLNKKFTINDIKIIIKNYSVNVFIKFICITKLKYLKTYIAEMFAYALKEKRIDIAVELIKLCGYNGNINFHNDQYGTLFDLCIYNYDGSEDIKKFLKTILTIQNLPISYSYNKMMPLASMIYHNVDDNIILAFMKKVFTRYYGMDSVYSGVSPLYLAIKNLKMRIVDELLKVIEYTNINYVDTNTGQSILSIAIDNNMYNVINHLLSYELNVVHIVDKNDQSTPLMKMLRKAIYNAKYIDLIKIIIAHYKCNIEHYTMCAEHNEYNALFIACKYKLDELGSLIASKIEKNQHVLNNKNQNILTYACSQKMEMTALQLLEKHKLININGLDSHNMMAIDYALDNNLESVIQKMDIMINTGEMHADNNDANKLYENHKLIHKYNKDFEYYDIPHHNGFIRLTLTPLDLVPYEQEYEQDEYEQDEYDYDGQKQPEPIDMNNDNVDNNDNDNDINMIKKECLICCAQSNKYIHLSPCGHAVNICNVCNVAFKKNTRACPVCRTTIKQFNKCFVVS